MKYVCPGCSSEWFDGTVAFDVTGQAVVDWIDSFDCSECKRPKEPTDG